VPGMGHGDGRFDGGFDTVGVLDAWVDRGIAPVNVVVTDNNNGRTRPLCEWPAWPKYDGVGNVKSAASFTCVTPAQAGGMLQAVLRGRREASRGDGEDDSQATPK
jgi:hypothetical protein